MGKRLFFGGLNWDMTDEKLLKTCKPFGNIAEAVIIRDKETGRSRGFGFVTFENEEQAKIAQKELHKSYLEGRIIRVNIAYEYNKNRTPNDPLSNHSENRKHYNKHSKGYKHNYGKKNTQDSNRYKMTNHRTYQGGQRKETQPNNRSKYQSQQGNFKTDRQRPEGYRNTRSRPKSSWGTTNAPESRYRPRGYRNEGTRKAPQGPPQGYKPPQGPPQGYKPPQGLKQRPEGQQNKVQSNHGNKEPQTINTGNIGSRAGGFRQRTHLDSRYRNTYTPKPNYNRPKKSSSRSTRTSFGFRPTKRNDNEENK